MGGLVDLGNPKEHASAYAEGISRGGTLVTVLTPDNRSGDAVMILEQYNPVDINQQIETWRIDKWQGFEAREDMDEDFDEEMAAKTDEMETSRKKDMVRSSDGANHVF